MQDYFWSARFSCGAVSMLLAIPLLIGGLLLRSPRAGLAAHELLFASALAASLAMVDLNVWALVPRVAALALWGAILFTLRHRIAPSHDAVGDPVEQLHTRYRKARLRLREWY